MATKHNTNSKALRAKATTKAAPKPKAKRKASSACPVAAIAGRTAKLAKSVKFAQEERDGQDSADTKAWYQDAIDTCHDAMRSNRTVASFLVPKSAEGVAYLLGSIDTDAENMALSEDKYDRAELQLRLRRAVYGIKDYLQRHGVDVDKVAGGIYLRAKDHPRKYFIEGLS